MIDEEHFDQIYDKYSGLLYRTAFLMTGNRQDAEDLLQDTFIIVFEHLHQLRDPDKLGAWLLRILTNLSHKKAARIAREIPDETVYEKADLAAWKHHDRMDDPKTAENSLYFHSCLLKIPPKQREALILYYYNDLPIKVIARICGLHFLFSACRRTLPHAQPEKVCFQTLPVCPDFRNSV